MRRLIITHRDGKVEVVEIDPWNDREFDGTYESDTVVDLALAVIGKDVVASEAPACCPGHAWYVGYDRTYHLDGFSVGEELAIYDALTG